MPERHGFTPPDDVIVEYDVVRVRRGASCGEVASMVGASPADIAALNPALLQRMTPPTAMVTASAYHAASRPDFATARERM